MNKTNNNNDNDNGNINLLHRHRFSLDITIASPAAPTTPLRDEAALVAAAAAAAADEAVRAGAAPVVGEQSSPLVPAVADRVAVAAVAGDTRPATA